MTDGSFERDDELIASIEGPGFGDRGRTPLIGSKFTSIPEKSGTFKSKKRYGYVDEDDEE
jgi:hypothetical protein